jgi:hypothetical protein
MTAEQKSVLTVLLDWHEAHHARDVLEGLVREKGAEVAQFVRAVHAENAAADALAGIPVEQIRALVELEQITGFGTNQAVIFDQWEMTCSGAPVQVEGKDRATGREMYFRERHGGFRVDMMNEAGEWETIASGDAPGFQTDMTELNKLVGPFGIKFGEEA